MIKDLFSIEINASPSVVWQAIWSKETFTEWASLFCPEQRAESDWQPGSKAFFLNDENTGVIYNVENCIPNELMSLKQIGMVISGVEDYDSDKVKEIIGLTEDIVLKPTEHGTMLTMEIEIYPRVREMALPMFPKSLEKIKEIAERIK